MDSKSNLKIIDFSPYHAEASDSLLFSWEELMDSNDQVLFKVIEDMNAIVPDLQRMASSVPYDMMFENKDMGLDDEEKRDVMAFLMDEYNQQAQQALNEKKAQQALDEKKAQQWAARSLCWSR